MDLWAGVRQGAWFRYGVLAAAMGAGLAAWAQASASAGVEELRQRERERALRTGQERPAAPRKPSELPPSAGRLPLDEIPCVRIERFALGGLHAEEFQWLLSAAAGDDGDDSPVGRCLGTRGFDIVLSRMQRALVARGWFTSRVLASPQDVADGVLNFTLVPGRIAAIRLADGASTHAGLWNAIPARPGDLLNLRDIEQGLENLKRAPTAEADIESKVPAGPGANPGDSDLVVKYTQTSRLRAALSLDDSGTQATGRYQAGATLSADNLLGLNDLFYVNASHSIDGRQIVGGANRGTEGQVLHYSVPYGYWLLGATASNSRYHQRVAWYTEDFSYAGNSSNAEVKLSRGIYRDQRRKTTLSLRAFRQASRNFIEDIEIEPQRRVVGGWELSLNHREFIADATLEANLAYERGTGAFGSLRAPEEEFGEGTSRPRIVTADIALSLPFTLGGQKLRYGGLWRAQWNRTALTPLDQFGIGGRYTVRGFDGETSLLSDRGWLVRNDLGWTLGDSGAELYAGVDYGEVGGPSAELLLGRRLAGGVLGLRGAFKGLNYDVFVGAPITKPEGFRTAAVTAGFNLIYSF
jgi:hemolysin activation/secretion protein